MVDLPNLVKVGIVKDQEVLVLIGETLDGVGSSLGEVPDITIVENLFLVAAILINGRNKNRALINNTPFGLFVSVNHRRQGLRGTYNTVPVELTNGALDQVLLGTRDVMARGKILDDLLTDPTTLQKTSLGIREAPLEVGNNAIVRRLTTEVVWVLEIELLVGAA